MLERDEDVFKKMQQSISSFQSTRAEQHLPYLITRLAEIYLKNGHISDALQALLDAQKMADKNREGWCKAEIYRIKGEVLLTDPAGNQSEVESCFQQAIEVARNQQTKSLELRAAMSMGRLWQSQGKIEEAKILLSEIYGWFTEGFDTADLKEARALLEELS